MENFVALFESMIRFTYHCFDRIVIHGYLTSLTRASNVVYFFRFVVGEKQVTQGVLKKCTDQYKNWVEAFLLNHEVPVKWAEKGVRKEEETRPFLDSMEKSGRFGVYFAYRSMEQGPTYRCIKPKYECNDPDHVILKKHRSRYTYYYFYIRDEALGAFVLRIGTFIPFQTTYILNGHQIMCRELSRQGVSFKTRDNAFVSVSDPGFLQKTADGITAETINKRIDYWTFLLGPKFSKKEHDEMGFHRFYSVQQVEYCQNFIFRRNFPIHRLFERSCELGLWIMTSSKIAEIFGTRLNKKMKGKLQSVLEAIDHGHHVFRAYCRNSFVKQYEKYSTFLRNEVCSNNVRNFNEKKGLDNLDSIRRTLRGVTDRFASFQAEIFNVHADFPLLQRLALPIRHGQRKLPGIKIHDTRIIRLFEVLIHAGALPLGMKFPELHKAILEAFRLNDYGKNQLRYDLTKLKAHGLIERPCNRQAYRLTEKGIKIAILFLMFHKRICGPLANSLFRFKPDTEKATPYSHVEKLLSRADAAINEIFESIAA